MSLRDANSQVQVRDSAMSFHCQPLDLPWPSLEPDGIPPPARHTAARQCDSKHANGSNWSTLLADSTSPIHPHLSPLHAPHVLTCDATPAPPNAAFRSSKVRRAFVSNQQLFTICILMVYPYGTVSSTVACVGKLPRTENGATVLFAFLHRPCA